jgi:hypothetical protein
MVDEEERGQDVNRRPESADGNLFFPSLLLPTTRNNGCISVVHSTKSNKDSQKAADARVHVQKMSSWPPHSVRPRLLLRLRNDTVFVPDLQELEAKRAISDRWSHKVKPRRLTVFFCASASAAVSTGRVANGRRSHVSGCSCLRTAGLSPSADFLPGTNFMHLLGTEA